MCRESVKMTATVASRYVAVIVFPRPLASYPVKVGSAVSGLVTAELTEVQGTCPLSKYFTKTTFTSNDTMYSMYCCTVIPLAKLVLLYLFLQQ